MPAIVKKYRQHIPFISMPSFNNIYISQRVRSSLHKILSAGRQRKFFEILAALKDGCFEIPGLNVEKLRRTDVKLFSARVSKEMRLIFSIRKDSSGVALIIHELNHHDEAYDRVARSKPSASERIHELKSLVETKLEDPLPFSSDSESGGQQLQLFRIPSYLLTDPEKYTLFEKSLDRYLVLSQEQEDILSIRERACLVQGPAGTGKTTLALFAALKLHEAHADDCIFLFTYHEELACVCHAYKVNLLENEEKKSAEETLEGEVRVFSYIDFCKRHLRQALSENIKKKRWINRQESMDLLAQILAQKSRWSRRFSAADLWGSIYSILKGRFMPASESLPASKEDYERIFKDYGRTPDSFEDILEIFAQYQFRLQNYAWLDEADIIRATYESLKGNALLVSANRRLWIVIDEVQDFTELEWKSILLFWENHCLISRSEPSYPFLSGDTNQNISRSGFRWHELESYLRNILKNLHRPNAIEKITLHKNFRNTIQIYKLASFIRNSGSEAGDLGLPPESEGRRPVLSITDDKQLLYFLRECSSSYTDNHPLVVLVENAESLDFLRKELSDNANVFLLSLQNSKGLEFEDVIIYRAFSSCQSKKSKTSGESARLFDLWYMGVTRARNNLLLFLEPSDYSCAQEFFGEKYAELEEYLDFCKPEKAFSDFLANRDLSTLNYSVLFLERTLAQELFDVYLKELSKRASDNENSAYAEKCKVRALNLWKSCLDYSSLGRALMQLQEYDEASKYLERAGLMQETATCLEYAGQYLEAAKRYEKLDKYSDAARCFELAHSYEKAARLYEKEGNWSRSAENYMLAGNSRNASIAYEKAEMFGKAAEIYKLQKAYMNSAELYLKARDFQNAAQMYLEANESMEAARCFEKTGDFAKALELYENLESWAEAANAAEKLDLHSKSAEFYLRAENPRMSACQFEKSEDWKNAGDLYAKSSAFKNAAQVYKIAGCLDLAALMYEKAEDWHESLRLALQLEINDLAARCLEKLGDFPKAAELYLKTNCLVEAASCLEKSAKFAKAAGLYQKAGRLAQAAGCLAKDKQYLESAKLYVLCDQVSSAFDLVGNAQALKQSRKTGCEFDALLDWCMEVRKPAAAAQLLELKKEFVLAAEKFKECLLFRNAAQCLEKSMKPLEAANLYKEVGELEKAANCYKLAKQWQEAACCLEKLKQWQEAKVLYERARDREGTARCNAALNWF